MDGIIIALIGVSGSAGGSLIAALISNKVWQYRIEQLEKKVDEHNNIVKRTYKLEEEQTLTDEKIKVINHRLKNLENGRNSYGISQ